MDERTTHRLRRGSSPVVVECPHAGLELPDELLREIAGTPRERMRDADLAVDRICAQVGAVDASLLVARLSRHVVDLNRSPEDLDRALGAPDFDRRGAPTGVVWRTGTDGRGLLKRPLTPDEIARRIERYHRPYHAALTELVEDARARHRQVLVLSVHSMPSTGRASKGDRLTRRADVVPGTHGRTTADGALVDVIDAHFRSLGMRVVHDDPYRGGNTTCIHGRPTAGVHAVQIELSRALYMDEVTLAVRDSDIDALTTSITTLVRTLDGALRALA